MLDIVKAIIEFVIGPGIVAALGIVVAKVSFRVKDIQKQVTNDHKSNLRDDMDKMHRKITEGFKNVDDSLCVHAGKLDNQSKDILSARREIVQVRESMGTIWQAVDSLRSTNGTH